MTDYPTCVQKTKKRYNTYKIRSNTYVCSFVFSSTILLVTRFGHLIVTPSFYESHKSWPHLGSFFWQLTNIQIADLNCLFLNLWSTFQPFEVPTCDIIELRQHWSASKSSSFNASNSVWYQGKRLNTHKKLGWTSKLDNMCFTWNHETDILLGLKAERVLQYI